jgi:phage replication O-like protein O
MTIDNPQLEEDGHLKIVMPIVDQFQRYRLSGVEWQILWVVFRKTYGWQKTSDGIALSQFVKATGLKKQHCWRAIQSLKAKNILLVTKNDYKRYVTYKFNKRFKTWKGVAKKGYVTKNGYGESPKMVTDESPILVNTIDTRTIDTRTIDTKFIHGKKPKPKKKKKIFNKSSIEYFLSTVLMDQITINLPDFRLSRNAHREKTLQQWSQHMDYMIRLDKRNTGKIFCMIIWCQNNDFWFKNIQSTKKLRIQFDRLRADIVSDFRRQEKRLSRADQKLLNTASAAQAWIEEMEAKN